jgi:uncharacterized protein (DUF1015 family)
VSYIKPFRALRPTPEEASSVACVPYDVIYDSEVRDTIAANPLSFLRVTRAEGALSVDDEATPAAINERAKQNLDRLMEDGVLVRDKDYAIYIYRLTEGDHSQTGVVACCSIAEYERGSIKKHELVRPDKVEDRTNHILAVGAQTGLIFLAFRNTRTIRNLIADAVEEAPLYDFTDEQGIRQTVWRITDTDDWTDAFEKLPALYIADGHHRAESAKLARDKRRAADAGHMGGEEYNFVMAGMFPAEDLKILPYNRAVKDLNGLDKETFLARLRENFIVVEHTIEKQPDEHGEIAMYLKGVWWKLRFNVQFLREPDPIDRLDVSILQQYVLGPVLGIDDPRTNDRIAFVGGRRGTDELERLVDSKEYAVAFSLFPTTMDDLLAVADANEIMPPKSTWFEPKLKDGLLIHEI